MNKLILSGLLLSSFLVAKEVSVFGAGDMDSSTPYGLTKAEKASYKNAQEIKEVTYQVNNLRSNIDELKLQLDGFKSVFDTDSKNLNSTKNKLADLIANYDRIETKIDTLEKKLVSLENNLDLFIEAQKKNNQLLQDSNLKLNSVLSKINQDYVSKKEFDELVKFVNTKSKTQETIKKKTNNADNNFGFKTNAALFDHAVKLHKQFYLTKSMPMFDKLIKDNYKTAQSSYYLADILHYKKRYKDAIHYYKKSMILDDKASYIPELLLNSAHSFEKLNDVANAKNFYQTLIDAYAGTKEAKEASKRLEKFK